MVSWRNPDTSMEGTTIEDYVDLGPLAASGRGARDHGQSDGERGGLLYRGHAAGHDAGLAGSEGRRTLRRGDAHGVNADFSRVGDTAVFLGEPAVDFIEQQMLERGYLDSRELSNMFNLLRSNDLFGRMCEQLPARPEAASVRPALLEQRRHPHGRAAHGWYLRNTYVENNLVQPGKVHLKGEALDLGRIRQDIYAVGAEKTTSCPGTRPYASPSSRRQGTLRSRVERPHCRHHQSARWQRHLLDEQGRACRHARALARRRPTPRRELVDGLVRLARRTLRREGRAAVHG